MVWPAPGNDCQEPFPSCESLIMASDPLPTNLGPSPDGWSAVPPAVNPYQPSAAGGEVIVAELAAAGVLPTKPRVWTVFVTILAAFVTFIAVQMVGAAVIVIAMLASGISPQELPSRVMELLTSPAGFIAIGLPTQLTLAAVAIAAAWMSPQPCQQRLGFVKPRWSWWQTLVVNLGTLVPFAIGMAGAIALAEVLEPDPTAANLMRTMTPAWIIPYLLFISLAPGFSEEMLFRGYSQRRLIERWGGWTAVLVTSAIFAIIHLAPHTVVFAFPVGIWLGLMAWKSGSVWPGVIAHAAVNGLWNAYNIAVQYQFLAEEPSWIFLGALAAVGVLAFAWSLAIMFARQTDTTGIPSKPALPAP